MTNEDTTKENNCNHHHENQITSKSNNTLAKKKSTMMIKSSNSHSSSAIDVNNDTSNTMNTVNTMDKRICRCVSICHNGDIYEHVDINHNDNKQKQMLPPSSSSSSSLSSASSSLSSSLHNKTMNRKRPRPNSFTDAVPEKSQPQPQPVLFSPLQNKKLNHNSSCNSNSDDNYHNHKIKNKLSVPSTLSATSSKLPSLSLNSSLIPASPVRSVVSCDLEMMDAVNNDVDLGNDNDNDATASAVTAGSINLVCGSDNHDDGDVDMSDENCNTNANTMAEEKIHGVDEDVTKDENGSATLLCSEISSSAAAPPAAHLSDIERHIRALRIEASLAPMKLLLSRLMSHPTHNRRGTFNTAVDHVALGLVDYPKIVKQPMDLGSVKKKLHSSIYSSHNDVASDVRLCFRNAMLFNPPSHPVHEAAAQLLDFFEKGYKPILEDRGEQDSRTCPSVPSPELSMKPLSDVVPPRAQHTCQSCQGRRCKICNEKCLGLEPTLVICAGAQCAGAKIRRGILYYCLADGQKSWCLKCYSTLPAVLPSDEGESDQELSSSLSSSTSSSCNSSLNTEETKSVVRYKRDLLKRRNDEDIVERWLTCRKCGAGVHEMCAFANEFSVDTSTFECTLCSQSILPKCFGGSDGRSVDNKVEISESGTSSSTTKSNEAYSFLSGQAKPEKIKHAFGGSSLDSRTLPSCPIAEFVESKLQQKMLSMNCPTDAEKTLTVRIISDCEKVFQVPESIRRHFRNKKVPYNSKSMSGVSEFSEPPSEVTYASKAIALFQRIDGMDICLFCMYVQEYDEEDNDDLPCKSTCTKRVYIAYIDSVEHFRPRELRTNIYHEILVAYLATARARGYSHAHIWSCPPSRGNSFVFWGHPSLQRTPTKDRLLSWYHRAICHGLDQGVITDVKSLYEHSFQNFEKDSGIHESATTRTIMVCPPILEGDFWLEEASRVHSSSVARYFRTKKPNPKGHENSTPKEQFSGNDSNCPAMHVAAVLQNDIMVHPSAVPFCRPVNAAALKLHDYHNIIKDPMDLGTVVTRCLLGEYNVFGEITHDIELVFKNAMRYNPKGHIVHNLALDLLQHSRTQLLSLVNFWKSLGVSHSLSGTESGPSTIEDFANLSMRLGVFVSRNRELQPISQSNEQSASSSTNNKSENSITEKINLLTGGPEAVAKRMVGNDTWLLEKKHAYKPVSKNKPKKEKAKPICSDGMFKQHESWLSDEVIAIVRRLRTDFFVCNLYQDDKSSVAGQVKDEEFQAYIAGFNFKKHNLTKIETQPSTNPGVTDTRHGLLEFSQYRNFQFDTIRRAKYSTAMLLFYLRNQNEPGVIPQCTSCQAEIRSVRWRKLNKAFDERRRSSQTLSVRMTSVDMSREELCSVCYNSLSTKDSHVPMRISFKRG